ncbi:MAG: HAD family phosphatase [Phycisphaeraceae bacterium]|nr:HAD family phosphatase [Phycisphaeraceae bacterium]
MTQAPLTKKKSCDPVLPAQGFALVAVDLDGTLLRSNKSLSRRAADAISQATEHGVQVVLASARPPRGVHAIYRRLGLKTFQVNYNGALIHDPHRGRHVFHQPLNADLARRIARLARRIDAECLVSLEILDKWYTDRVDHELTVETSKFSDPDFIGPLEAFFTVPVTKLMLLAPPPKIEKLRVQVKRRFGSQVAVLLSDAHVIQIVHRQVDKAVAVKWIADADDIPASRVLAIGDAPNDVGMLRWAGLGVAVANAWPAAMKAADVTVSSNDDDGVAEAIEKYVLS